MTWTKTCQVLLLLLLLLLLHILVTSILCFLPFTTTIVHKTGNTKKKSLSPSVFLLLFLFLCSIAFLFFLQDGKKKPQKTSVKKRSFALLGNFNSLSVSRCVCVSLSLHRFCNSPLQDIKYEIHQFWLVFSLPFFFPSLSVCKKKKLTTTINNCCMLEAIKKNSQQILSYSTQKQN